MGCGCLRAFARPFGRLQRAPDVRRPATRTYRAKCSPWVRLPSSVLSSRIKHIVMSSFRRTGPSIISSSASRERSRRRSATPAEAREPALRPISVAAIEHQPHQIGSIKSWGITERWTDSTRIRSTTGAPAGNFPYSYLAPAYVAPYWAMAKVSRYAHGSLSFPTMFGGSFTAHLDLIWRHGRSDPDPPRRSTTCTDCREPWGCDAPGGTTRRSR